VQGRVSIHYAVKLLLLVVALVVYQHNIILQSGVHPSAKGVHPVRLFGGHFSFQLAVCKQHLALSRIEVRLLKGLVEALG